MRRLLALFIGLLLASSLGLGSASHAFEPATCIEAGSTISVDHADDDGDEVPADAQNGYPHHHGGCHGHHVGVPISSEPVTYATDHRSGANSSVRTLGTSLVGDPALRPPQA